MQDTLEAIAQRLSFKNCTKLFLSKCICESTETSKSTYAIHENVLFKQQLFFAELEKLLNQLPKGSRLEKGLETLTIVTEELGFELEKETIFLLYHLRNQGKFAIKDTKLKAQLNEEWLVHKDYLLNDRDFALTIKSLMRLRFIDFRKGNLRMKPGVLIRYKS